MSISVRLPKTLHSRLRDYAIPTQIPASVLLKLALMDVVRKLDSGGVEGRVFFAESDVTKEVKRCSSQSA